MGLVVSLPALAADTGQLVDSGSFGIFVGGKRVATETFEIRQRNDYSSATAELKVDDASRSTQKAELQLSPAGDLRRYEWRELSPGRAQAVVEPDDQFLLERITPNPPDKPVQQPFFVPLSTMVLDDYFFSQREILAWRYLAQSCNGNIKNCRPGKLQFGVLVPRQHLSMTVTMEYTGLEKVLIRGAERQLNRINLQSDAGDWVLWIDGDFKVVRVLNPAENTEVVRD
jgi:hypothetical protein